MGVLIAGILLFLLPHSVRIVGEIPRARLLSQLGEARYKGLYSLLSVAGLVLIVWGYGEARYATPLLYAPGPGIRHLALVLVPLALVAVIAAYTPPGAIKHTLRHPMVVGVGLWALGHLLANGSLADVVLFGSFLIWALVDYIAALRREPRPASASASASATGFGHGDVLAILISLAATAALLGGLHQILFGVSPLA